MTYPPDRWAALGERVEQRRRELGFSRVDVQKIANLSEPVVRGIEKGEPRNATSRRKLSLGLGWTPDSIERFLSDSREPVDIEVALTRLRVELVAVQAGLAHALRNGDDQTEKSATAEVERLEGEIRVLIPLAQSWADKRDATRRAQPQTMQLERRVSQLEREVENIKDRLENYDPFDR
jgi:hypothetical protein